MFDLKKELVNAFNLNNYYSDKINTNFIVEGGKIVGLFDGNVDIKKYIKEVKSDIIALHCGSEEVASEFFNLDFFPFSADEKQCVYSKNRKVKKLVIDIDSKVVSNLKLHFVAAFKKDIEGLVATRLTKEAEITKEEAFEYVRECTRSKNPYTPSYLYSISFDDEILQEIYVNTFKSRLQECGLNSSVFHDHKGNELYIKDITDVNVVKSVAKYVAGRVALDFKTSGNIDSKIENCKNALSDLILKLSKRSIDGYDYDVFTDEKKKRDGYSFALIPKIEMNGTGVSMTKEDACMVNQKFREDGFGDILIDIMGETKNTQCTGHEEPVYGISNKQLALLIPELMHSPIGYAPALHNQPNKISTYFEYAFNLGSFYKSREHSDLSEDLNLILTRKCIPKDGKAHDYIVHCLLKSGFGLNGYDEPELAQFVNQKIKEWRIVEENRDTNRVMPQKKGSKTVEKLLDTNRVMPQMKESKTVEKLLDTNRVIPQMKDFKTAQKLLDINRVISQAANSGPSSLGVDSSVGGSKGSLSSSTSNESVNSSSSGGSDDSTISKPLHMLFGHKLSPSQVSNEFSVSSFGTSPVEDENSKFSYQKPDLNFKPSTSALNEKVSQMVEPIPSIKVHTVEDENSKLSYQKPDPNFKPSTSALNEKVSQIVKQVAGTAKVAPIPSIKVHTVEDENSKLSYQKPGPSFKPSTSALNEKVSQIVKQAAKAPKVAPEGNKLLSKSESGLTKSTDAIKGKQSQPNEQAVAGSSSEDYKPSSNMVSTESKPHKPKRSVWSKLGCTIS